ncbi:hypothetical protein VIBHAR_02360 [Vibrio campbellii ATCC BAA-1116]|uniref:Uncharacterized protein n=1 Tax=Vibrio campbellii (strain ATCC BAA-1116) TaxID=2902295 RepID=A7N0J9_VIBC1|nr:hypothetical protein VIBHAR_02360 [Vibrio campbellii ATCC BAA-1116]
MLLKVSLVWGGYVGRKFEQILFVKSKQGEVIAPFLVA